MRCAPQRLLGSYAPRVAGATVWGRMRTAWEQLHLVLLSSLRSFVWSTLSLGQPILYTVSLSTHVPVECPWEMQRGKCVVSSRSIVCPSPGSDCCLNDQRVTSSGYHRCPLDWWMQHSLASPRFAQCFRCMFLPEVPSVSAIVYFSSFSISKRSILPSWDWWEPSFDGRSFPICLATLQP